jgi:hypothetical protein
LDEPGYAYSWYAPEGAIPEAEVPTIP